MYTVGHKNVPLYFCPYLRKLFTNFQNSFNGTLYEQFAVTVNAFLHYLVKYKCKQKLTIKAKKLGK